MSTRPNNGLLKSLALLLPLLMPLSASAEYEEVIYYHNDALGSPVLATDANGDVLWQEDYTPYGSRLRHESRELSGPLAEPKDDQWDETAWFTGKQEETRLGILNFGARWYEPELGRFLAMDPVGVSPDNIFSFNRYAYANNNPYAFFDPDGREVVSVNSKNNKIIESYINTLARGVFKFDSNNKLQVVTKDGSANYSSYYRDRLIEAINDSNKISIDISEKFTTKNGKIVSVDKQFGGGLTAGHVGENQRVIISGNSNNDLVDISGNLLNDPPEVILSHELLGHAIPKAVSPGSGNAVKNENRLRSERGLKLRMPERNHREHN